METLDKESAVKKVTIYREKGFVMMEVMVLIMLFLLLSSSLLTVAASGHKRAVTFVRKEEAYCAALSAVRLMANEVMEYGEEEGTVSELLLSERGMKKKKTELVLAQDGECEVSVPVTLWTKRSGDELTLYAEAELGGCKETVSMMMVYQDTWIPIAYGMD